MLQLPVKRAQRQQRLSTACDNPLLEAKQAQSNAFKLNNLPAQKRLYKRQQHRRQLSAPDESVLLRASGGTTAMPFGIDDGAANIKNVNIVTFNINVFPMAEQQQPSPVSAGLSRQGYTPNSDQTQHLLYPRSHSQHTRKGSVDSMQQKRRESLLNPNMRPLAPAGRLVDNSNIISQDLFAHSNEHPMPLARAHTMPLMSISTFDLAPLPHTGHFMNLSSLAMGSPSAPELDDHPFYSNSHMPMSPGFASHDVQQQMSMFDAPLQGTNQPALQNHTDIASSPVPPTPSACHTRRLLLAPAPVPTETAPLERADVVSGITMEEIASFIAGPEPSDGKWVCLYEGCSKRFGRKENIKSHVQTHLGDRQFKCQVCKKCFVRQHDLKRHSKIHTGVKPYPCLCGNSFARHDALTRHRQRGMCIGAFEGVVRKEVKRGRPRKKPLPKDETRSSVTSSAASDTSSSDAAGQDETASTSPTPSAEVESPGGIPDTGSSDEYSPPTSPAYDVETFAMIDQKDPEGFNHMEHLSSSLSDYNTPSSMRKGTSTYNSPGDFPSSVDMGLFVEEIMELTALERDPTILNFDDTFIKSELLEASEQGFYGV